MGFDTLCIYAHEFIGTEENQIWRLFFTLGLVNEGF